MQFCSKRILCVAALLIAAVLPASAGSITYKDSTTATGKGVTENVTATFTLTKSGSLDLISAGALTFSGALGSFTVDFIGSCLAGGSVCSLSFLDLQNGDTGTYNINLSNMSASGSISGLLAGKLDTATYSYSLVPEGGSRFSYLAPAGLVIFGGIFLTGFFRPRVVRLENF